MTFMSRNPQLNRDGSLQHLLTIEGLPRHIILGILDAAAPFTEVAEREVKKVTNLRGKSVFNLFFENSTRTRTTFEIAAKRLSADVINLNINTSSTAKGETLLDTVDNLAAMQADMFVVRHATSGAPYLIAQHLDRLAGQAADLGGADPGAGDQGRGGDLGGQVVVVEVDGQRGGGATSDGQLVGGDLLDPVTERPAHPLVVGEFFVTVDG